MKRRCLKTTASQFVYYGGRGITVCQRWRDSFEAFLADMGEKPSAGHSLDRINNDGNYEPSNCRWVRHREQMVNSRTSRMLTHNGTTDNVAGWASRLGVRPGSIVLRLRRGWSVERALAAPLRVTSRSRR